ncbi:MAG: beta-eliminating lyase-related protein [Candidatus Sulfotelmatobacter sp.]
MIRKTGDVVPNNTHFDTTRANVEFVGAEARDLGIAEGRQPKAKRPFKGNMDVEELAQWIQSVGRKTRSSGHPDRDNTSGGGQPVSVENVKAVNAICQKYGIRSSSTPAASPRIRPVEIGTLMFAAAATMDLVRLAIPRRAPRAISTTSWKRPCSLGEARSDRA